MKQQLISATNTALLFILLITVAASELTKINPPVVKLPQKSTAPALGIERTTRQAMPISQIYGKRNIFGLDWDPLTTENKLDLTTPSPLSEFKLPEKNNASPKEIKDNIIEPLNIALNGIVTSSNEGNNACIISDSSSQEKMYRVGDQVLDSNIIDIAANSVSLIRPNGQIECFRIIDAEIPGGAKPLSVAIQKLEEHKFVIDPQLLTKYLTSLGQLIEELGVIPQYKNNNLEGFLITKAEPESLGIALGLASGDVVNSIFNIKLDSVDKRIEVYDKILASNYGAMFKASITRNNQPIELEYRFDKQATKKKSLAEFLGSDVKKDGSNPQNSAKDPKADAASKNFNTAPSFSKPAEEKSRYVENINTIRKRLLENANRQRFGQPR